MSYLYLHQTKISLLAISLCVLLFCIFVQWGKGLRLAVWALWGIALGALTLTLIGPFVSARHEASYGSAYTLLVGVLSVMIPALGKLVEERRMAGENRVS